MNVGDLNDVENELIDFLAERRGDGRDKTLGIYTELKSKSGFGGKGFKEFCLKVLGLHAALYNMEDERQIIEFYRRVELLSLLRLASYSYRFDELPPHYMEKRIKGLLRGDKDAKHLSLTNRRRTERHAASLAEMAGGDPVVVDYGCGLAYLSFTIAGMYPNAKVYLVDIDALPLAFAAYRFRRHGLDVEVIRVTPDNLYPGLPPHNICIATEVFEHVKRPGMLYDNITASMMPGGILHGDMSDHEADTLHISPSLGEVRARLEKDYTKLGKDTYKKKA